MYSQFWFCIVLLNDLCYESDSIIPLYIKLQKYFKTIFQLIAYVLMPSYDVIGKTHFQEILFFFV